MTIDDGWEGRKVGIRGRTSKLVAEFQREDYHNSTVPVKEYLEVIDEKGDPSLRSGQVRGQVEKIGK